MFAQLPETFPERNGKKKPAILSSVALHILVVLLLLAIPLLMAPDVIKPEFLTRLYLPPPAAPAAPLREVREATHAVHRRAMDVQHTINNAEKQAQRIKPGLAFTAPATIPRDIATLADLGPAPEGIAGGVPGGVPEGVVRGMPGLSSALHLALQPPPPPRPQPAQEKIYKVGGYVKEPRLLKYVAPEYPRLARSARISGTVVLEAIVTKAGNVANVRVISGPLLLHDAAIQAVRQWRYEPTRLNGLPVAVALTAKVTFGLAPTS